MTRRTFLRGAAAAAASPWWAGAWAPMVVNPERARPVVAGGVQSGDVSGGRAVIWSRCDRPARMLVEWDTDERFARSRRVDGPVAHYYNPARARFQQFLPFWEFVAGPLHAGTFGPNRLDPTFGPEVKFCAVPAGMKPNRPPSAGLQFFGTVHIDGREEVMTVSLLNTAGERLFRVALEPERVTR